MGEESSVSLKNQPNRDAINPEPSHMLSPERLEQAGNKRLYTHGNPIKHISVLVFFVSLSILMTFTANLGAVWAVGQLKQTTLVAALGYSTALTMLAYVFGMSFSVPTGIMTAKAFGLGNRKDYQEHATFGLLLGFGLGSLAAVGLLLELKAILQLLGARGEVLEHAYQYSLLTLPVNGFLSVIFVINAIFRSMGKARISLYVTAVSSLVILLGTPLFIFVGHWGLQGAAYAYDIAYVVSSLLGLWLVFRFQVATLSLAFWRFFKAQILSYCSIAFPVMASTLLQVTMSGLVLFGLSQFHNTELMAALTVSNQLSSYVFVGMIALNGAMNPIFAQFYGAKQFDKFSKVTFQGLLFALAYTLPSVLLYLSLGYVGGDWFHLNAEGSSFLFWLCVASAIGGLTIGLGAIVNAGFIALGKAYFSLSISVLRIVAVALFVYAFHSATIDLSETAFTAYAYGLSFAVTVIGFVWYLIFMKQSTQALAKGALVS